MGSLRVVTRLILIVAVPVLASLVAAAALPLQTYKPRDVVKAPYGPGEAEFGFKNWDGEGLGALFFAVGGKGAIYIYDGVKGNIKVFGSNGAFAKTIKAVPWEPGIHMPEDMTLMRNGDIYALSETSDPQNCYEVFLMPAGVDTVISVSATKASQSFCHDGSGGRVYGNAGIMSDQQGGVYVVEWGTWKSAKLVDGGRVLSDSSQLSSLREGVPMSTDGFVSYCPSGTESQERCGLALRDEAGHVVRDWSKLEGGPVGIDRFGSVYLETFMKTERHWHTKMVKYSPDGRLLAVVDIPMWPGRITNQYGKYWIIGDDGSIYQMSGRSEAVIVRKWERVK